MTEWVRWSNEVGTEAVRQCQDLLEAANREATLLGHKFRVRGPALCPHCDTKTTETWFASRGWVCIWCEETRSIVP